MFKVKNDSQKPFLLWKAILFALAYFLVARIGLSLATLNHAVSPFWPATGLSFGVLFFAGLQYWPAIAAGAFLANIANDVSFAGSLLITIGNTLHGIVGLMVLNFFLSKSGQFGLHKRTVGILSAAFIGAFISASIGSIALVAIDSASWEQFQYLWITWFTGDSLGAVIFFPLILAFLTKTEDSKEKRPTPLHLLLISLCGLFLMWLIFIRSEGSTYMFFVFPFLFWVVAASGEKGIALTAVLISIFGVYSAKFGFGVFKHGSLNSNLINLELFTLSIGLCSLMMTDLKKNYPLKQPGLVLFISWLLAGLFFFGFYLKSIHESEKHFGQIVGTVEPIVEARLNLYFSALQSGTGLFAASETVEREEWKSFLSHSEFDSKLPGIDGLGVVFKVKRKNLDEFIKKARKDNAPDFSYHILPDLSAVEIQKANLNEDLYIVTYIEPSEKNKIKIGLDLASEEIRKSGADLARDLGTPTITEKITLVDDPHKGAAFLLYYPLYTKGPTPKNIDERRERIQGWIYTPLKAEPFFNSIFSENTYKEILFQVTDKDGKLLASSPDFSSVPSDNEQRSSLRVGNRLFEFSFRRSPLFYSSLDAFSSWAGAFSSVISLLIGFFIVSLQNVKRSALQLAEQKTSDLKASEELWKYALQGAGDCAWDWDIPSGFFKFSDSFKEILGYDNLEFPGGLEGWLRFLHPDDQQKVSLAMKEHFENGKPFIVEQRVKTKNGPYKWILSRGMIVKRDVDQVPLRIIGTISDISSFKEAEHELERQRSRLQTVYDSSSDALLLWQHDRLIDCNSRALLVFGYVKKDEFINMHPSDFSPPLQPDGSDSRAKSVYYINRAFETGRIQFEWLHKKKSGEVFPAEVTLTVFNYDGEKCIHASVRDITERKQTESSLNAQREKLVAAAKMSSLGEMAGGIAHEINNPLAIIIGKVAQLKRRLESQYTDDFRTELESLSVIETTAKRIASIIKGLSAFSRNAEKDNMEQIEVLPLIMDTLELSKERYRFNSVELKFNSQLEEKTYIMGKPSQLLQVLINLLNNAYDAVEFLDERWVEVDVSKDGPLCRIAITDSGPGIPPHLLEKIMTPFFTTKKVGKGTGLGLSISRGLIEEHKGKLYYDSKNPHTRFVIELPIT